MISVISTLTLCFLFDTPISVRFFTTVSPSMSTFLSDIINDSLKLATFCLNYKAKLISILLGGNSFYYYELVMVNFFCYSPIIF